ncbi:MAG: 50S ribosomal protein L25/general stress protein Ctc [Tannerellaceae bacterium]|nr:50S ribosomal protein L25 [Porphyromonadaceae bacterium]
MKVFQLAGSLRTETGKKAAKAIRNNNSIPCIIYGGETVSQFTVEKEAVRKLIYSPEIFLVELTIDGKTCKAIMKDLQFHPVTDAVLHIDFLEVFEEKPIVIDVPVVLDGLAEGVKAGGKLSLEMRKLRVKALYNNVPEQLHINIENLALGKTIQVGQVAFENLEVLSGKNNVICAVKLTRAARGAAAKAGK